MEKRYIAVIKEIGGSFYGCLPDFTLSCTEVSREAVVEKLLRMANCFVSSVSTQLVIPSTTSENVIRGKWDGWYIETVLINI